MIKPKEIIILGGGFSIQEGIEKGLYEKIKNKCTIGLNFSYRWFDSTFLCIVDGSAYELSLKNSKEKFKNLPLIVTKRSHRIVSNKLSNTLIMNYSSNKYYRDLDENKMIYSNHLVGLFALTIAIHLLNEEGTKIMLLGFDGGSPTGKKDKQGRYLTHYYQGQFEHRGVGKIKYYEAKDRLDKLFGVYKDESSVKIYNVCPTSLVPTFEKIDYDRFFEMIEGTEDYNQEELREYITSKLRPLRWKKKK